MDEENKKTDIQTEESEGGQKKYIIYLIIGLVAAGAAFGWWYIKNEEKKKAAAIAAAVYHPPVVTAMTVKRSDMPVTLEYTGQTAGMKHAEVRAQVGGIIKRKLYKEGASIRAGQVMFVIEPAPYQAAVGRNRAALKQSEVNRDLMKIDFDRASALYAKNAASKAEYDTAQSNWNASLAQVDASKAALRQSQIDLDWTRVRAPISGFAGQENYSVGNLAEAGSLLATVVQSTQLYVDFAIPADTYRKNERFREQGWLKTSPGGIYVELALGDGTRLPQKGRINFQNQFVTPETASINARAIFDNAGNGLYAGQFVRVYVKGEYVPNVIQIPLKSTVQASEKSYVFKLSEKNIPEKAEVTLLSTVGNICLVGKGLKEGDRIVLDGVSKVQPGKEVAVKGAK